MDNKQNPYHEHKLLHPYHLKRAKFIIRGEVPVPSTIEIDVTDEACNQACIHCCFNSNPTRKLVSIDPNLLVSLKNQSLILFPSFLVGSVMIAFSLWLIQPLNKE